MARFYSTRRRLIGGAAAALAIGELPRARTQAQAFPSCNLRVVIPTGQGGGADRLRARSMISGDRC